jgi:hypothetical protein
LDTWLLSTDNWDLVLDASGNWAVATDPYSVAQDVSSAVKTFVGDVYYDTTDGIPYFTSVLGIQTSLSAIKFLFVNAALSVPEVASAVVYFTSFVNRRLSGQVQSTLTNGTQVVSTF